MKALRTVEMTGPDGLRREDVPTPSPGVGEIAVAVCATALNRADLMQTLGRYPAPEGIVADIPGLEYSGEVSALGPRVTRWKVGDPVMGLVGGGAWAQTLITHEREAMRVPQGVRLEHAAAIPEAFSTAFDALVTQGGLTVGTEVLVHAAASGVGTAAIQLCRLFGARVIGTARSAPKLERLRLGPDGLLTSGAGFADQVNSLTRGRGVDLVLDLVGGDFVPESIRAMATKGTLVLVGLVGGRAVELPLHLVLQRRLRIQGTALRSRPLEEKIAVARAVETRLVPQFEAGALTPVIDSVTSMSHIVEALGRMANNDTFGKLVLTW